MGGYVIEVEHVYPVRCSSERTVTVAFLPDGQDLIIATVEGGQRNNERAAMGLAIETARARPNQPIP